LTYWQDHCNIPVTKATRETLMKLGSKGESYDTIITRLIASYEAKEQEQ